MKTAALWGLIALNGLLLCSFLASLSHEGTARAQVGGAKPPGEYIMIDGTINGSSAGLVYMVDTRNGQLGAMTFPQQNGTIQSMPPIDLAQVFDQSGGTAKPRRGY